MYERVLNLFEYPEREAKKKKGLVLSFVSSIESTSDKFSSLFFRFEAVDGTIERDNRWVEARGRSLDKCR